MCLRSSTLSVTMSPTSRAVKSLNCQKPTALAEETASEIKEILTKSALLNDNNSKSEREFYLTDVSDTFISVAGRFLGERINKIQMVDIVGTTQKPSL